ncbi:hypothetical protein BGZ98_002383 [Dissophora globulifera]|nr:hypothetical protein BGZ98_002383 [Dissophora globulifera]
MQKQQRAAQRAAHQQQMHASGQKPLRPIQRHSESHQQAPPGYNQPIAIKPHPQPPSLAQSSQPSPQAPPGLHSQAQTLRPGVAQSSQRLTQQQILQRYQQQRQLQQKQQQLRQLQYLRNRPAASYPTQKNSHGVRSSPGSNSPTPPRVFGAQVDRPIRKSTRPLECSNCMTLDSLTWKPKADLQMTISDGSAPSEATAAAATIAATATSAAGDKILCPACTQYLQTHGKPRPVPPFRSNFLKKIHTRFKRELQEVRFQGWQDAQVLEIEDRMSEREFQMVFNGLDESDVSHIPSRHSSVSGSPAPPSSTATIATTDAATTTPTATTTTATTTITTTTPVDLSASLTEAIVIKIEDDDDEAPLKKSKPDNEEVRTFQSEASVGELFGQRWRTEPVVGYTLVHFGGSDRTRMVPMNPTVPSLTVTFNRSAETITFAFRMLVNGLCLLSSGGGPPALHMPEMADDEESEEEEEDVVMVPDNDKEDSLPSPSPPATEVNALETIKSTKGDAVASITASESVEEGAILDVTTTTTAVMAESMDVDDTLVDSVDN